MIARMITACLGAAVLCMGLADLQIVTAQERSSRLDKRETKCPAHVLKAKQPRALREGVKKQIEARCPLAFNNYADIDFDNLGRDETDNLCHVNFNDAKVDVGLAGKNLESADFIEANLSGIDLKDADLRNADLRCANLHSTKLNGATMEWARIQHAKLIEAFLKPVSL